MGGMHDVGETKARRKNAVFFVLFLIGCVALIFFINEQKVDIPVRPVTDRERIDAPQGSLQKQETIDYGAIVRTYTDQAAKRNMNAMKSFELDIYRIANSYERRFRNAAVKASEEASAYTACVTLVYYMAWDKIASDHKAEKYIEETVQPYLHPLAQNFSREINAAMRELDADLHRSTLLLVKDLSAMNKITPKDRSPIGGGALNYQKEMEMALGNLAKSAASVLVSMAFDGVALWRSQIFQIFCGGVLSVANSVFGSAIAGLVSSGTIAIVDGPLPVGDIIAVGGGAWTMYDIYSSRRDFEKDVHRSLENAAVDAVASAHTEGIRRASELLKEYQDFQDQVGTSTLEAVMGGGM